MNTKAFVLIVLTIILVIVTIIFSPYIPAIAVVFSDWEWIPPTIVALFAAITSWRARTDVKTLHLEVNSRLSQLLKASISEADAKGHTRGRLEEVERQKHEDHEDIGP